MQKLLFHTSRNDVQYTFLLLPATAPNLAKTRLALKKPSAPAVVSCGEAYPSVCGIPTPTTVISLTLLTPGSGAMSSSGKSKANRTSLKLAAPSIRLERC